MLRDVSRPTRILMTSIALAGGLCLASAASASTVACDEPVVNAAPAAHATRVARTAAVHPTTAASNSTRHVSHDAGVHHRRHPRTHHAETSLRAHVVTAASLPARLPARPRVPRSSHRAAAPALSHRDAGTRAGGPVGLPFSTASALSLAILGTCVHQRTRDRLRSVSQPLESRGPPRAGPHTTLAACRSRGARESTVGASALHPPIGGSSNSRVSPSPLRVRRTSRRPSLPASRSSARTRFMPSGLPRLPLATCAWRAPSRRSPVPAVRGPMAPRGVPVRGQVLYDDDPSIRRNSR